MCSTASSTPIIAQNKAISYSTRVLQIANRDKDNNKRVNTMTADASAKVDAYLAKHEPWSEHLLTLRKIMLATDLEEAIKWGTPTYTLDGKNVVGLVAFKNHCAIWFHQGVFLQDQNEKLVNAQEATTKALRQWRFEAKDRIDASLVKSYVLEAIDNQRAGKEIKPEKKTLVLPVELENAFKTNAKLRAAFDSLSAGKQREYADHVASAKREATRVSRLEKIVPMVLAGVGLHDKYKNC